MRIDIDFRVTLAVHVVRRVFAGQKMSSFPSAKPSMNTLGRKKTIDFARNIARLVFRLLVLVRAVQELPVLSPRQQMGDWCSSRGNDALDEVGLVGAGCVDGGSGSGLGLAAAGAVESAAEEGREDAHGQLRGRKVSLWMILGGPVRVRELQGAAEARSE